MEPIFKRTDFSLCNVPVPEGYPQSQTHAGIGILNNGQYVLTTSPYPSVRYKFPVSYFRAIIRKITRNKYFSHPGEYFENPCIYVGDSINNDPPVSFKLASPTPLIGPLSPLFGYPSFNSDPDLFIENNKVYVLNRSIYRQKGTYNYYMRLYLIEGIIERGYFLHTSTVLLREGNEFVCSQCMTKYKGNYILTDINTNSYNDGQTFGGIRYFKSDSVEGLSTTSNWCNIKTDITNMLPWHMSLFQYKDVLYTIIACVQRNHPQRCWQMLGEFNSDLKELKIYNRPLTDYNSYRGSAIVLDNGVFVLYNTTVREKFRHSKSVDGRDVIVAKTEFEELIKELRKS